MSYREQVIPYKEYARIVQERKAGRTVRDIAEEYGVTSASINRVIGSYSPRPGV